MTSLTCKTPVAVAAAIIFTASGALNAFAVTAPGAAPAGKPQVAANPPKAPPPVPPAIPLPPEQVIKAQVLLDRAHFSPGAIDGRDGGNLKEAIMAFEAAHGLPIDGRLDPSVWSALTAADTGPVTTAYVITAEDVSGPFLGKTPTDMVALSKLRHLDFDSPPEELAERFHMDQALLTALNPGANFGLAGTSITVVVPGAESLTAPVGRIEVDKTHQQVRAFDAAGKLEAVYPATVGSQERPAPTGALAVRGVARNPTYTYDPSRLTFGRSKTKLTIQPGPNNPVGSTWIGLNKDTYGIHGAPDPTLIGKTASHGCVRLTNWDARQLGLAVKPGVPVAFLGDETRRKTPG